MFFRPSLNDAFEPNVTTMPHGKYDIFLTPKFRFGRKLLTAGGRKRVGQNLTKIVIIDGKFTHVAAVRLGRGAAVVFGQGDTFERGLKNVAFGLDGHARGVAFIFRRNENNNNSRLTRFRCATTTTAAALNNRARQSVNNRVRRNDTRYLVCAPGVTMYLRTVLRLLRFRCTPMYNDATARNNTRNARIRLMGKRIDCFFLIFFA